MGAICSYLMNDSIIYSKIKNIEITNHRPPQSVLNEARQDPEIGDFLHERSPYAVLKNGKCIGFIAFDDPVNNQIKITSLYIIKNQRSKGYGKLIIEEFIHKYPNLLIYVFISPTNLASIKSFVASGFKFTTEKTSNF